MSALVSILRQEIASGGPIPFRRFMEVCLTHPEHGYYRRTRDPFGKTGDYFTAEQLQPVYGVLIGARVRMLFEELGEPEDFTVVELGAGRAEMAPAFSDWRYIPVDLGHGALPERFTGVVFANEFFDALPVHLVIAREGGYREMLVGWGQDRFVWIEGGPVSSEIADYLRSYLPPRDEGTLIEVNLDALRWLERIARSLERGFVLTIDYGYTARESVRFPRGTLMSYRRHQASDEVLRDPGERDLTAHICFTALQEHGRIVGLDPVRFESLSRTLLMAGERDAFATALAADTPQEERKRRLQLKTLLFGMGETFRTLIQRRAEAAR